jgi:2-dehydropantoate 2-reductase
VTRIAIVGAGAIGCTLGARLLRAGLHEVAFATRSALDRIVVVAGPDVIEIDPVRYLDPRAVEPVPWVLLATKAQDTEAAAPWLRALAGEGSTIAILQNGVEHVERVRPHAPGAELLPVVVDCPASRAAPGRVVQHGAARLTVADTAVGAEFRRVFSGTGIEVATTRDLAAVAWRKLCENAASGAITAWTRRSVGVILRPRLTRIARDLVAECAAVARAQGVALDDAIVDEVVAKLRAAPPAATTSLLRDRLAGRTLELDARNGAVVRIGARHGIDASLHRRIVARIERAVRRDSGSARPTPSAEESLWSEYDAMEARLTAHVSERMLDLANLRRGARVLDLAAGRGEPAIRAATRVAPEGSVVGIDVSAPMLGMARARARSEGVANLELRVMDAESLAGLEDRSFDAILARWCAMYFSQPRRAFLEARRVIRPDGAFVVAVWAEPERVSYVSVPRDLLARRAALTPIDFAAPGTFRFARPGSLERELADAGFVVRSVEERDTPVMEVGSGAELVRWCETFGMGRLLKDLPEATRRAWAEDLIAEGERRREGPWIRLGGVTRIVTASPR